MARSENPFRLCQLKCTGQYEVGSRPVRWPGRKRPTTRSAYFDSSPEVIRPVVMMYVKYPLSLRTVEDLLFERGIDICHETVRLWWNRFGPMFAAEIRKKPVDRMRAHTHWNGASTRST